jgi:hypothetical protein
VEADVQLARIPHQTASHLNNVSANCIDTECYSNVSWILPIWNSASDHRNLDSITSRKVDLALTPFELPHIPEHCRSHHRLGRLTHLCRLLQAIHFPPQLYIPAGLANKYCQ